MTGTCELRKTWEAQLRGRCTITGATRRGYASAAFLLSPPELSPLERSPPELDPPSEDDVVELSAGLPSFEGCFDLRP